jgi:hypothetical protein
MPDRSLFVNTRRIASAVVFMAFCCTHGGLAATTPTIDWRLLETRDTLALFVKDQSAGTVFYTVELDSQQHCVRICTETVLADLTEAPSMRVREVREYDLAGALITATQDMASPAGSTRWSLEKNSRGEWAIATLTAGMLQRHPVSPCNENLKTTYAIQTGIIDGSIRRGRQWQDTMFELTTGKINTSVIECASVPAHPGERWVFICRDNLIAVPSRWEVDQHGRTQLREIPPLFLARRLTAREKRLPGKPVNFAEAFRITRDRAPSPNETLAITIPTDVAMHPSVAGFYTRQHNRYLLSSFVTPCPETFRPDSADTASLYLQTTPTIQTSHPQIRALADSLTRGKQGRCAVMALLNRYVDSTIQNRDVATFSNALATLQAGFGDCGEHAVLLAALLRASGIEARVVLGLVYIPGRKGYFYHAWVMARTAGEWVFCDPALGVFPAADGYIPLIIDDTGAESYYLANLINRIGIEYLPRN